MIDKNKNGRSFDLPNLAKESLTELEPLPYHQVRE
jgi:hypothetical protein